MRIIFATAVFTSAASAIALEAQFIPAGVDTQTLHDCYIQAEHDALGEENTATWDIGDIRVDEAKCEAEMDKLYASEDYPTPSRELIAAPSALLAKMCWVYQKIIA